MDLNVAEKGLNDIIARVKSGYQDDAKNIRKFEHKVAREIDALHKAAGDFSSCRNNLKSVFNFGSVAKSNTLGKGSKRNLQAMRHGGFTSNVLPHKSSKHGTSVVLCTEPFGTQPCALCGSLLSQGTSKTYSCCNPYCLAMHHRDVNGTYANSTNKFTEMLLSVEEVTEMKAAAKKTADVDEVSLLSSILIML
jgi:transposase